MEHDAIVVGGGPGGSTAAWRLALAGLRPLVLDAAVFPRVKICAGWVTPEALADLEVDPDKYPLTIQPFDQCVLEFAGAEARFQLAEAGFTFGADLLEPAPRALCPLLVLGRQAALFGQRLRELEDAL